MTMQMEAGKWSRNLNEEVINESNRSRLIEKQRQLLETKRTRQQQVTITSTRPKSARSLRPASSLSRSSDKLDNRDVTGRIVNTTSNQSVNNEDDYEDHEEDEIVKNHSARPGTRSRSNNKRNNVPSPSMSPNEVTVKGRNSSSSTTNSSSSVSQNSKRQLANTSAGRGKSLSSSYDDLKDDVETIKSMDINDLGTELNPLKAILNSNELLLFATQPVSPCKTYQCIIMRDKRGIDRSFYPTYYIYLQSIIERQNDHENDHDDGNGSISSPGSSDKELSPTNSKSLSIKNSTTIKPGAERRQVFLLGGRRRKKSKTYLISNDPFDITRDNCIAKLKSNVLGTLFNAVRISGEGQRFEISTVIYETNVLGFKGPRKMTVLIPKNDEVCPFPSSSLMELWKADPVNKSLISLKNKTPVWNEDTQSYVLNFHGRVTQPSVKNFQLVVAKKSDSNADIDDIIYAGNNRSGGDAMSPSTKSSTPPTFFPTNPAPNSGSVGQLDDDIAMQFGRISDKEFTCDVTWPLSILQAFCIALSSFDSKLACE